MFVINYRLLSISSPVCLPFCSTILSRVTYCERVARPTRAHALDVSLCIVAAGENERKSHTVATVLWQRKKKQFSNEIRIECVRIWHGNGMPHATNKALVHKT